MSRKTREFFEQVKDGEPPKGAIEAIKEGIQAVAPGLSLSKMFDDIGSELSQLASHGRTEMAAALFNGSPFVLYMKGQEATEQSPDHGLANDTAPQKEVDGREM